MQQSVCVVGRGGNKWESPAGCLMFSLFKRVSITGTMSVLSNSLKPVHHCFPSLQVQTYLLFNTLPHLQLCTQFSSLQRTGCRYACELLFTVSATGISVANKLTTVCRGIALTSRSSGQMTYTARTSRLGASYATLPIDPRSSKSSLVWVSILTTVNLRHV